MVAHGKPAARNTGFDGGRKMRPRSEVANPEPVQDHVGLGWVDVSVNELKFSTWHLTRFRVVHGCRHDVPNALSANLNAWNLFAATLCRRRSWNLDALESYRHIRHRISRYRRYLEPKVSWNAQPGCGSTSSVIWQSQ